MALKLVNAHARRKTCSVPVASNKRIRTPIVHALLPPREALPCPRSSPRTHSILPAKPVARKPLPEALSIYRLTRKTQKERLQEDGQHRSSSSQVAIDLDRLYIYIHGPSLVESKRKLTPFFPAWMTEESGPPTHPSSSLIHLFIPKGAWCAVVWPRASSS